MLRRLLTLLAVISGLALAEGPVVAAQADVVSMAQAAQSADCVIGVAHRQQLPGSTASRVAFRIQPAPPVQLVRTPAVILQADRAHE